MARKASRKRSIDLTYTELFAKRSEFITSPPISTVSVVIRQISEEWSNDHGTAILRTAARAIRRSEGISIRDLMDVVDGMRASFLGNSPDVVVVF